jgi:hypothetical protein
MTDWESVLPSNEKEVRIMYANVKEPCLSDFNELQWVFMVKDDGGAKYQNQFTINDSLREEFDQNENIELVARRIEKIASDTIRQYVQEEMFSEHVED